MQMVLPRNTLAQDATPAKEWRAAAAVRGGGLAQGVLPLVYLAAFYLVSILLSLLAFHKGVLGI